MDRANSALRYICTVLWTVMLAALATSCAMPGSGPREATIECTALPLSQSETETSDAPDEGLKYVVIGGCVAPSSTPNDKDLGRQHADFLNYMQEHGIKIVAVGSVGVSFNVRSDHLAKAEELIKMAVKDTPGRWSELQLKTQ